MARVNFTSEHKERLFTLALSLLFSGETIKGILNTSLSVWELIHNTTVNTLITINMNLKKEVEKIKGLDEWSMTDYQKRKLDNLSEQQEFVNLLIGYKKLQEQVNEDKAKLRELKLQYEEIKKSSMTPDQQLAAMEAAMKELEQNTGEIPAVVADVSPAPASNDNIEGKV